MVFPPFPPVALTTSNFFCLLFELNVFRNVKMSLALLKKKQICTKFGKFVGKFEANDKHILNKVLKGNSESKSVHEKFQLKYKSIIII